MPVESDYKEFGARVPTAEYERFRAALPQYGAVQWFVNTVLKGFNDELDKNPRLLDVADKAVKDMLAARRNPEAVATALGVSLNDLLDGLKRDIKREQDEGRDTATSKNSAGTDGAKSR